MMSRTWPWALCLVTSLAIGCQEPAYRAADPARGPGSMVGNGEPLTDGVYTGGVDAVPTPRETSLPSDGTFPDCGPACTSYCQGLNLENAVNQGMCASTWGVGLSTRPVRQAEACRRLFVDMLGRFPTHAEVKSTCNGRPWGEVVTELMARPAFVATHQRRWADILRYDTEAISVERIYDADRLVKKLFDGKVPYDQFASVLSAHPVLTRRYDTPGDRAEALFGMFMGRPPLGSERSDVARLYTLWTNGYYDHPQLGMRLPDAVVRYQCVNEQGARDPNLTGECTSVLYGYNELVLEPDFRAEGGDGDWEMWSGLLRDEEWGKLGMPGKLLSEQATFWEYAVDRVLELYLGYDLGRQVPEVRDRLVAHLLANKGDIRSLHHAVLTSQVYLQSATGTTPREFRWTWGPLKQVDAEVWLDSIEHMTTYELGSCDWRLNRPEAFLDTGRVSGYALVQNSRWQLNDEGEVRTEYRRLARTLGGCPSNDVGGRFRVTSILTTATQLDFVTQVCDPTGTGDGIPIASLLPSGVTASKAVNADIGEKIMAHQIQTFFGRAPSESERLDGRAYGERCERQVCKAEAFARPTCYALLSSAEMLYY